MSILSAGSISATTAPAASNSVQRVAVLPVQIAQQVDESGNATPSTPPVTSPQLDQIQTAVERLKQAMKPALASTLEFQIDKGTGKAVVMIFDAQTHALVRQIPSQEVMAIAEAIDRMQGRGGLVKQKA